MDSILRRLVATWIKSQELAPRRAPAAAVRCESLEGRQLLSTTGLLKGQMGMPSSPTAQRVQFSQNQKAMMGGQNARGFGAGSGVSTTYAQVGQGGGLKGQGFALGGGVGRGGFSLRNSMPARATWQNLPNAPTSTLNAPLTTSGAPAATLAVNAVDDVNPETATTVDAVPTATLATDTTTLQADSAPEAVATTQIDEGAVAVRRGAFHAMPTGPLGGWFGGQAGNREFVTISKAPGQPGDGGNVHFGNVGGGMAEPSEALQQDFEKLQTDLQAIHDKSEVTPKLLAAVRNDFDAIQEAATKDADPEALKTLAATVDSFAGQIPTEAQRAQLVADFTAVLKSQGISDQTLIDTAVADIQAVVAASHVTADDLATIAADRQAIEDELKADAGETTPAIPATGDAVDSLFTGLTGGFESGAPLAHPILGGGPVGPFSTLPIDFSAAGGVMMESGLPFDGSPITISPSDGGMTVPARFSHESVMNDGGDPFGPFSVSSTHGVDAMGQFSDSQAVVSYAGGGTGGQSAQFRMMPASDGMGGQFSRRWGR